MGELSELWEHFPRILTVLETTQEQEQTRQRKEDRQREAFEKRFKKPNTSRNGFGGNRNYRN